MAYERQSDTKVRGDSLDTFVTNLSNTYKSQVALRNAADETRFNEMVLEDNLSLPDQLEYRKEQLKRVEDDPTEKKRLKAEISALKDRIEQKKFADSYLEKLISYESGLSSIDTVISFLQTQKDAATDQTIIDTINKELASKNGEKFKLTQQLLSNQTEYAMKDKSDSMIESQITRVNSAKTKALLAGDETTASMLDLQLQGLTKAKLENSIDKDIKNFAVSSITGYATATKLLDAYNSKIAEAADNVPVKIGDVTYSSAKEFWTYKRDSYIADSSAAGFFSRIGDEVKTKINVANSKNGLTSDLLADYAKEYTALSGRPELAGYEMKIETGKQDVLQTGTNAIAETIINRYSTDYDINKAVSALNNLKSLGVNVDAAYSKIITTGASIKTGAVNNILAAAQVALTNNPNLTPEQALNQAIATGAGTVLSPQELARKDEKTIANDFTKTATNETGKPDPNLTIGGPTTPAPTPTPNATPNQPAPNTPASTPAPASSTTTITVKAGDTLSALAQRYLGSASRFNEIAALNNISDPNKIQVGAVLKIPGQAPTPAPAANPAPAAPAPAAQPAPRPQAQPTPAPTPAPQAPQTQQNGPYQGGGINEYLASIGQDTSFENRKKLAQSKGFKDYAGDSYQNAALLKALRGF